MNVYPPFKDKLEILSEDQKCRVLISFDDLFNRENFIKKHNQLEILGKIEFIPSILVDLKKSQINKYQNEELIKNIEENQIVYPAMLDVNEFLELTKYKTSEISYTGKNVNVGIIDDGINGKIPSLSNVSLKKYKTHVEEKIIKENGEKSEISHGTVMASIISNRFEDINSNFIGIAPDVNIYDFDISNSNQEYSFFHILNAFDKINKEEINLDILFITLTTKSSSDGKDLLSIACDSLSEKGIIVICPTGNFGPNSYTIGSPGAAKKVITIGALTKELKVLNSSGRGPTFDNRRKPDLYFPGSNIHIPITKDLRLNVSGTSVATAIGVGIIALIKEYDSSISYDTLVDLINKTKIDINYDENTQGLGTIKVSNLFDNLGLKHDDLIPYNYLIKKAIKLSVEFLIILIVLFYFFYFFRI